MKEAVLHWLRPLAVALLLLLPVALFATHQRAGEISYTYVSGLTYEFTIVTYTYTPSPADRPEIEVSWGDGTSTVISRLQKINLDNNISKNVYVSRHTFSAAGTFHVTFEDPNRNAGIINIPSSVEVPFFIETIVVINPFIGGNSSPQLMTEPIDNGCTNVIYYHNPGAYDPDGDSLSYSLISCRGYDGEDIPGYSLPNASNSISIDPVTGDLIWDSPTMAGEYNIAILIQEWRNGVMVSSMVRDMQITIAPCNNQPPEILVDDTCVLAGTRLVLPVTVIDTTSSFVTLTATGELLLLESSPVQFMPITDSTPYTTNLVWNTNCGHVRIAPYTLLFKAQDNGPQVPLVAFKTLHVRVVAPAPDNLQAQPVGNRVRLTWSPDSCPNAVGYDVYRRDGSNPFEPEHCETGMPAGEGYYLIGNTAAWDATTFVDDGSAAPLYHANDYCYRVVARFPDGAESYVSDEVCVHIIADAPLIINADVVTTDSANGTLKVRWIAPPEIDSTAFPPPYYYNLYRFDADGVDSLLLNASPIPATLDTMEYLDHDLNTRDKAYTYRVQFFNADTLIETSDPATSIFLRIVPADRRLQLSWSVRQPWTNMEYVVYRLDEHGQVWDSIGTTPATTYTDGDLVNGEEYCYYVRARGYYWVPDTIGPLYNRSQRVCASPFDNEPPELPVLSVSTDCDVVTYSWTFSSDSAAHDAYWYYIYYKPTMQGSFVCVDSFAHGDVCWPYPCEYQLDGMETVVGCFAMKVADSNRNVSALSDTVCMDIYDCLDYSLPNVFTPNGDGINDVYQPIPPYQGVEKVDMKVYNRWGRKVFSTENPDILWDGTDENSHQPCSEGVFYYSCEVYVRTLTGENSYPLHGSITLIR
ncbi:MAG: gliding motility-associated C-terminal domain-containing protein [Bacteroidales bacterium]|nr:gliding motility-associated C-terminal domain-containing protein [Bacteroidales bacterium]